LPEIILFQYWNICVGVHLIKPKKKKKVGLNVLLLSKRCCCSSIRPVGGAVIREMVLGHSQISSCVKKRGRAPGK